MASKEEVTTQDGMVFTDRQLPNFANEAEEGAWFKEHQDEFAGLFEKAKPVTIGKTRGRPKKEQTAKPVTIRLDPSDLALAKGQASKMGIGYQTYLKTLLHQALEAEESA